MSGNKINSKANLPKTSSVPAGKPASIPGVAILPLAGGFTTRSFGEIFDQSVDRSEERAESFHDDHHKSGDAREDSPAHGERREDSSQEKGSNAERSRKNSRTGPVDQEVSSARSRAGRRGESLAHKEGLAMKNDMVSAGEAKSASIKKIQNGELQALFQPTGMSRNLAEAEQAASKKPLSHIPPQVLDELLAQISHYYGEESQRVLKARLRDEALGGKLAIRVEEDPLGSLLIAFEGDSHVVKFLQAHQEELQEVLVAKGLTHQLTFLGI